MVFGRHRRPRRYRGQDAKQPDSLWRHKAFLVVWGGQSVSLIGSQVSVVAMPLVAIKVLHATTLEVSLIGTLSALPWLVISLPAGVIVDRHRKRNVMIGCDLVRALTVSSVPVAGLLKIVTLWQLYVVATIAGVCAVLFSSSYLSYPTTLLEREQLIAANTMNSNAASIAAVAGPNLAGFLVGLLGAARAIAADALSYLVSILTLLMVRTEETVQRIQTKARSGFVREMFEGLHVIVENETLRRITLANSLGSFLLTAINTIWILYAIRELGWSVQAFGVITGLNALGAVVGSLVTQPLVNRFGLTRVLLYGQIPFAPAGLVAGLVPSGRMGQIAVVVAFSITAACAVVYNTLQRSYRMMSCEKRLLGRLNASVNWLQWGVRPLAALLAGGFGTWIGLQPTLLICAALLSLCPLVLWLSPLRREARSSPITSVRQPRRT